MLPDFTDWQFVRDCPLDRLLRINKPGDKYNGFVGWVRDRTPTHVILEIPIGGAPNPSRTYACEDLRR